MLEFNPKRADRLLGINDINSRCVLHLAIEENCLSTLELLLAGRGKKLINDTDKDYKSCLHYAAEQPGNDVSFPHFSFPIITHHPSFCRPPFLHPPPLLENPTLPFFPRFLCHTMNKFHFFPYMLFPSIVSSSSSFYNPRYFRSLTTSPY